VKREVRRGNRYQGILLDPPSYGHGTKGETWKLEEQLLDLLDNVKQLLDPEKGFLVLNLYSLGFSSFILGNVLDSLFGKVIARSLEVGELVLKDQAGRCLPTGVFGRFFLGK
jgi:23S rRNA (cytosine1962-C5)-methyltransferase